VVRLVRSVLLTTGLLKTTWRFVVRCMHSGLCFACSVCNY